MNTAMVEGAITPTRCSTKRSLQSCNYCKAVIVTALLVLGVAFNKFLGDFSAFSLQKQFQIEVRAPKIRGYTTLESPRRNVSRIILLAYPR